MSWQYVQKYIVPVCAILSTFIDTVDFSVRIVRCERENSQSVYSPVEVVKVIPIGFCFGTNETNSSQE